MIRIWAIIERDLRRFRRSPALIVMSMVMPLIQLVVLGYAFGGKIKHLEIGVVNQDHGLPALQLQEMFQAVAANAETFTARPYHDEGAALYDLRQGKLSGVLSIPPLFSRKVLAGAAPQIALIEDNTDQFASSAMEGVMVPLLDAYRPAVSNERLAPRATLAVVEVYPYVPYIQYLLPGSTTLAIFVCAMIGGGIIFIDDKARGLHEGYLVTPISKFELILGFNLAGVAKAVLSGLVLITIGSLIAGIPDPLAPLRLLRLFVVVVATALALISMMFLLVVRVNDPLLPRALFGVLNTLLFFPSGAVYPTKAFPLWMQLLSRVDPFTYAVDAFKSILLRNTGLWAVNTDLLFLLGFTVLAMSCATALFRRTL